MTCEDYNAFCASLPATTYVQQWGGAHVWKVGGKVFAIRSESGVTFKATPMAFDMLKGAPGVRPAPYLASRGMSWLQRTGEATLSDDDLRAYLRKSHELVAAGLTRAARRALGVP